MELDKTQLIGYAAIIVIVVSLATIGMRLTGYSSVVDTAVVNVTISSAAAINFTTDAIDFGAGSVTAGQSNATLNTEGVSAGGSWGAITTNLTLVNIGNVNVSLGLKSDNNASAFLGGTSPHFQFKVLNYTEVGSCSVNNVTGDYTEMTTASQGVCTNFPFADYNDTVTIAIQLVIPSDSFSGTAPLTSTITATGTYT